MHYLIDLDNTLLDTYYVDENGKNRFYWAQDFEKDFNFSLIKIAYSLFPFCTMLSLVLTKFKLCI